MKRVVLSLALVIGFIAPIQAQAVSTFGCPTGSSPSVTDPTKCVMDIAQIAKPATVNPVLSCPAGYTFNLQKTWCIGTAQYYTGTPTPSYYCPNEGDILNSANGTCSRQVSTTYNATYALQYYYCPSGGSLSGSTCVSSGSSYPASISYYCTSGTLSGTSCVGAPTIYYGYTSFTCRDDGGTYLGSGACQFSAGSVTGAVQSASCPYGGYYNGASSCITSGTSYNASAFYDYVCNSGDTKNGDTCTTPATTQIIQASQIAGWTCNSGDIYLVGKTVDNCEVSGSAGIQPISLYANTCPTYYQLDTSTGNCNAVLFNQVELFADQVIWNCTTTLNGAVVETGIYTYDDSFSLPTLKRTCTQSTNQMGTANGLNGFYMCQITLSTGTIYSFQSTLDLTGSNSTSWTYCMYTGDLEDQKEAEQAGSDEMQFEGVCSFANNYQEWLFCWRSIQI